MRSEESHNLSLPLDRVSNLPPRLRELLTYASYRAAIGDIGQVEMGDPYPKLFGEPRPAQTR